MANRVRLSSRMHLGNTHYVELRDGVRLAGASRTGEEG